MARVKRGVTVPRQAQESLKAAKGYYGRRKNTIRVAKQAVEKAGQYAFRDRKRQQAHLPRAVDPAPERRGAAVRPQLQPLHRRPRQGRRHRRPQGAVRSRDPRAGGIPGDRREGQGRAAGLTTTAPLAMPAKRGIQSHRLFVIRCAGVTGSSALRGRCHRRGHDHVRHRATRKRTARAPSRRPRTRRRWKPCASRRSARAARSRRCSRRSAR